MEQQAYTGYASQYAEYRELVENALTGCVPQGTCFQQNVEDAMRYSLLGGGKRLRGVLTLAFCQLGGGEARHALPLACAVEMVHAYSLVHDDLPCMDDDDLRRGKPTCHIRYGEAVALLAGDGLLTGAFERIADPENQLGDACRAQAAYLLARAAGTRGMIGGQVIDIENEGKELAPQLLDTLHGMKTGALIRGAAALGCLAAGADAGLTAAADDYAARLGLVFQIVDDILDVTASPEDLGKSSGSDAENGKSTYVTLYGLEQSRRTAARLTARAKEALPTACPGVRFLWDLADDMAARTK